MKSEVLHKGNNLERRIDNCENNKKNIISLLRQVNSFHSYEQVRFRIGDGNEQYIDRIDNIEFFQDKFEKFLKDIIQDCDYTIAKCKEEFENL